MSTPLLNDLDPIECSPRTINATYFGGRLVSTVRLTMAWSIMDKEYPYKKTWYPYETLIFDREGHEIDAAHYLTREAARAGHFHACLVHIQSQ